MMTMSLHKLVTQSSESETKRDYSKPQEGLQAALLDHIQEIETELETSADNLSAQAAEHIHSSELILTLGYSRSVEIFLKNAAKQRKFEVVVAECAPGCRVSNEKIWAMPQIMSNVDAILVAGSYIGCITGQIANRDNRYSRFSNILDDVTSKQSDYWHAQCTS